MRILLVLCAVSLLLWEATTSAAEKEDRLQKPVIPHEHIAQLRAKLKELGFGTQPFDEVAQRVVDTGSPQLAFRLLLDGPEVRFWNTSWARQENVVAAGQLSRIKLVHLAEQAGWGKLTEYPTRDVSTAIYRGHPEVVEFIPRNWEVKPENEWWLAEAAEHKQLETVELFIRLYEKEPWFAKQLPRALSEAVQAEQLPIVERLLAAGADPNEVDPFAWYNPLQLAVRHKETQILELLLAKGATLDACAAAGLGRLDDLKRLVSEPLPRHLSRSPAPLPLFWAAQKGQLACLQYLLAKGADVNARGRRGWTPLHMAILSGDVATVELLLAHQADPLAMAEVYFDRSEFLTPLHISAADGKLELVRLFVERGVSPWLRCKQWARDHLGTPLPVANCPPGSSALQLAVLRKRPEVVRYLLQLAVKELQTDPPQLSEENADTALSMAAAHGEIDFCRQLLAKGAKLEGGASITGTNPLEAAAGAGQLEVVKLLLAAGANPGGTKADSSSTPLHLAAKEGHAEVARLLLETGAAIDTHSPALPVRIDESPGATFKRSPYLPAQAAGMRPLTLAAQQSHIEVVKLLLARGAQPDLERTESPEEPAKESPLPRASRPQKVKRSETPLEAVLDYYLPEEEYEKRTVIAQLLIDAGARLDPSRVKDCLEKVAERGDVVRLELLERADAKVSPDDTQLLKTAIENGNRQFVQALIVRGVLPIALRDYHSYPAKDSSFERATPLMIATIIEACPNQLLPLRNHFELPATLTKDFSDPLLHCGELLRYYGGEPLPPDPQWLARAIEKGDIAAVKQLLASGYTPNSMPRSEYPPIYKAVYGGRLEIAQLLVAHGANLESFADGGSGLLTLGPDENPDLPAMMDLLVKLGANPNYVNKLENTPLHTAILERKYVHARALLARNARHDVFTAAAVGSADDLAKVLANDAELIHSTRKVVDKTRKATDKSNLTHTPLDWALTAGNQATVALLLHREAHFERSPRQFSEVVASGNHALLVWLLEDADLDPLPAGVLDAALDTAIRKRPQPKMVKTLLAHDADPAVNPNLLCMAAQYGNVEIIDLLVEAGSKVNAMGNPGPTNSGNPFGEGPTKDSTSPLRAAVSNSSGGISETYDAKKHPDLRAARVAAALRLLELGADPRMNAPNIVRDVVQRGEVELLEKLLAAGADPNERIKDDHHSSNDTALHSAMELHDTSNTATADKAFKIIVLLLHYGADPTLRSDNRVGRTPLDLAKQDEADDVVQVIERAIELRKQLKIPRQ